MRAMKPTTIKDIARELGVAVSTVSRALQDHPDISEATKQLVRECAQRLNYKPNLLASNLRTSKNTTIGVMMPELNHHFFASVLDGIEQTAKKYGYNILICQSREDVDKEVQNVQTLLHSRVAGMLVVLAKKLNRCNTYKMFWLVMCHWSCLIVLVHRCHAIRWCRMIM